MLALVEFPNATQEDCACVKGAILDMWFHGVHCLEKFLYGKSLSAVWNQEVDEVALARVTIMCSVSTFSLASTR